MSDYEFTLCGRLTVSPPFSEAERAQLDESPAATAWKSTADGRSLVPRAALLQSGAIGFQNEEHEFRCQLCDSLFSVAAVFSNHKLNGTIEYKGDTPEDSGDIVVSDSVIRRINVEWDIDETITAPDAGLVCCFC